MKNLTLAFVDLEMTGLLPMEHEIIEIGIVLAKQVALMTDTQKDQNVGKGKSIDPVSYGPIRLIPPQVHDQFMSAFGNLFKGLLPVVSALEVRSL